MLPADTSTLLFDSSRPPPLSYLAPRHCPLLTSTTASCHADSMSLLVVRPPAAVRGDPADLLIVRPPATARGRQARPAAPLPPPGLHCAAVALHGHAAPFCSYAHAGPRCRCSSWLTLPPLSIVHTLQPLPSGTCSKWTHEAMDSTLMRRRRSQLAPEDRAVQPHLSLFFFFFQ